MIWINFGKWRAKYGKMFCAQRIYREHKEWTPFVWITPRYLGIASPRGCEWYETKNPMG